jgi:uncharacterized protein YegL
MSFDLSQKPFDAAEFMDNPEPRCPCLLILDTSASMQGEPIRHLNAGLVAFKDELIADAMAVKRVEVAVVTFGPVQVVSEFQTADVFTPPVLTATGATPMGEAIERGLDLINARKAIYKQNGISYYRPWVFLITDGGPTDSWANAASLISFGEISKSFTFFAAGVEGANMEILGRISPQNWKPLHLKELRFRDLFVWLSSSLGRVSASVPGDTVPLASPVTPDGWAEV